MKKNSIIDRQTNIQTDRITVPFFISIITFSSAAVSAAGRGVF